jgi:hypothetical protein
MFDLGEWEKRRHDHHDFGIPCHLYCLLIIGVTPLLALMISAVLRRIYGGSHWVTENPECHSRGRGYPTFNTQ